ncbi:hypothetical protein P4I92_16670 [Bacillus cereus]|uniref:hypothetical protein n=1 Tax=Bacillus thuringiensis TaxID=1428 RepID=UPI0026E25198|nr:hypothetical protein [Bacillus thuringiensis]MDO6632793.1 hypothetical protein [Bacillus thuringiensis]MDO6662148.1 hypothetical protein [Bacillus thuringiensis]MDO6702988.1 hypothetical protein [Bacillus thuringiensis]
MFNQSKKESAKGCPDKKGEFILMDEGLPWRHLPEEEVNKMTELFRKSFDVQNPNRQPRVHKQNSADFNVPILTRKPKE